MKRPFGRPLLAYALGILLAEYVQLPFLWISAGAAVLVVIALLQPNRWAWLLMATLAAAGATNLTLSEAILSPRDLRRVIGEGTVLANVRGKLRTTPEVRASFRKAREELRYVAYVDVTEIRTGESGWSPAVGTILINAPSPIPQDVYAGRSVELMGLLLKPAAAQAEGLFDYRQYLQRQGVYYQLRLSSTNGWVSVAGGQGRPLADLFLTWSRRVLARGLPVEDEPLRLLWAMTLGWKGVPSDYYEPFMLSGTMHIFAISGLHIVLIAGMLAGVLTTARVPKEIAACLVIPIVWGYTMATGWQPSAIRSALMMTIVLAGWVLHRPGNLLNSLAAAAFLVLLWDPQQLFGASFQLSFAVVLSIALFAPVLSKLADRLSFLKPDPLLPTELLPRWKRAAYSAARWATAALTTSVAAFIGSVPLIATYFHVLSPVTILANFVVIPFSSAALACNVASLFCGAWLPGVSELFNHSAWFWMKSMSWLSQVAAIAPFGYFYVRGFSTAGLVMYCCVLLLWLSYSAGQARWRSLLWVGIVASTTILLWDARSLLRDYKLTLAPSGQGMLLLCDSPVFQTDWLIDPGPAQKLETFTVPFLHAQGRGQLPPMVLSHGDAQHCGAAQELCAAFGTPLTYVSGLRFRSPGYRKLTDALSQERQLRIVWKGSRLAPWEVLHPADTDEFSKADDGSMVLRGVLNGWRILVLPDLGAAGQTAVLSRGGDLKADVIIATPPAGDDPVRDEVIDAVRPRLILMMDTAVPRQESCLYEVKQRLRNREVPVLFGSEQGIVSITISPAVFRVRSRTTGVDLRLENFAVNKRGE